MRRKFSNERGESWALVAAPALFVLAVAQDVEARMAPVTEVAPSSTVRGGAPPPTPTPARPQPLTPAQPAEFRPAEEQLEETPKRKRRRPNAQDTAEAAKGPAPEASPAPDPASAEPAPAPDDPADHPLLTSTETRAPQSPPPAQPRVQRQESAKAGHAAPAQHAPPQHTSHAPARHEDEEAEEPFDPQVRQNVAGTRVTPEWDAEKIINTDRPDFTDVLPVVGKGVWQTESGMSLKMRRGEDYTFNRWAVPETTIRLGLTRNFELRIKWDSYWFSARTGSAASPSGASYGSDFLLGFKWQAVRQAGWVPGHTFLGTLIYHAGTGRGPAQTAIQPGLNWCYGWQINKWLVFRGSTGFEVTVREPQAHKQGDGPTFDPPTRQTFVELHQSVVSYIQVLKRLGMYYEWFGFWYYGLERGVQHNGGVGAYIYLTPNIQLDVRYVGTLNGWPKETALGFGLSFRGRYDRKKGPRSIMR